MWHIVVLVGYLHVDSTHVHIYCTCTSNVYSLYNTIFYYPFFLSFPFTSSLSPSFSFSLPLFLPPSLFSSFPPSLLPPSLSTWKSREQRKQAQMSNPHYLKESPSISKKKRGGEEDLETKVDVSSIPVSRLELGVDLVIGKSKSPDSHVSHLIHTLRLQIFKWTNICSFYLKFKAY